MSIDTRGLLRIHACDIRSLRLGNSARRISTSLKGGQSSLPCDTCSMFILLPDSKLPSFCRAGSPAKSFSQAAKNPISPQPKTPRNKTENSPNINHKSSTIRGSSLEFGDSCASSHLSGLGQIESCRRESKRVEEGGKRSRGSETNKQGMRPDYR